LYTSEVETVLLTPGDGGVEPTLGSTMLVDFAMGMDRDGVVSVALTDELTELLAMAEGETSSRPVVDEGAGVAVEVGLGDVRLGEGVKAVLVLATGNGRFVSDADTTLVLDVSESGRTDDDAPSKGALVSDAETKLVVDMSVKVGVSSSSFTEDDVPSNGTLLLSGTAMEIETSAGGMTSSGPGVSCADPDRGRKSVRKIMERRKGDIMLSYSDKC
jgi:hypothetical protein